MKKLSLSLMLNVSLALMLALSLIYPQSVAVRRVYFAGEVSSLMTLPVVL